MNDADLARVMESQRRSARGQNLDVVDSVLALLRRVRVAEGIPEPAEGCPVCAARRRAKTEAQKKWRLNRRKMDDNRREK